MIQKSKQVASGFELAEESKQSQSRNYRSQRFYRVKGGSHLGAALGFVIAVW